jgi:hypothetical protein
MIDNDKGYGSRKGKQLGKIPDLNSMDYDLLGGGKIKFKRRVLTQKEVAENCTASRYNRRYEEDITEDSLKDILPSIKKQKRNTHPALAERKADGTFEIMVGLRRTACCSIVEGAKLVLLYAENIPLADKLHMIGTSDIYKAPGARDTLQSIIRLKNEPEEDEDLDNSSIKLAYDLSDTQLSEYNMFISFADLVLSVFPKGIDISYSFLRELNKYSHILHQNKNYFNELASKVEQDTTDEEYWQLIRNTILRHFEKLTKGDKPKAVINEHILNWANKDNWTPGIKVKTSQRQVSITFHPQNLTPEKELKLRELLSE